MRVVVDVEAALLNEGKEVVRALERSAVLSVIDDKWMQHLRELDSVKEGIGLRSFTQKDPLLEYKEAFDMFKQLIGMINQEVISLIWKSVQKHRLHRIQCSRLNSKSHHMIQNVCKLNMLIQQEWVYKLL